MSSEPDPTAPTAVHAADAIRPERPLIHFTPRRNWINDPNGLILHKGLHHLYFQHNPHGDQHGDMSWGHATSSDLVHWDEHPIALMHDDVHDVFSGSVVWDEHNTSGLGPLDGPGPLIALYTAAARTGDHQAQAVAVSLDDGFTWSRYAGNPVLDLGTRDFRDPKVFRHTGPDGSWWVMVAVEADSRRVVLFRSDDLLRWEPLSRFGPAGAVEGIWECPDLFPLDVEGEPGARRWVLLVSVSTGAIAGGSGIQCFVGDFDGTSFVPDLPAPRIDAGGEGPEEPRWLDRGRDCYAGATFTGMPDDRRTLIAWMSSWDTAHRFPTTPWRGSMTVARRLGLRRRNGVLEPTQAPVLPTGDRTSTRSGVALAETPIELFGDVPPAALLDVEIHACAGDRVALTLGDDRGGAVRLVVDRSTDVLALDCTDAGAPSTGGSTVRTAAIGAAGDRLTLRLVIDTTSIEVFAEDGAVVLTEQILLGQRRRVVATGRGRALVRSATLSRLR